MDTGEPSLIAQCRTWAVSKEEIVAIDGKTLRRSYDIGEGRGAIHMVSA